MYLFNQFGPQNIINIFKLIPFSIAIYMTFIGLGIKTSTSQLKMVQNNYKNLMMVCLNNFLIVPTIITLIGLLFELPPLMIIALLLIASGQGGKFSFITTYLMRGNYYSQFWQIICSSLVIIIVMPTIVSIFSSINPETKNLIFEFKVDYHYFFLDSIQKFILPFCIGMGIRQVIPELASFLANKLIFIGLLIITIFLVVDHSNNFTPLRQYFEHYYYALFIINFFILAITFITPMLLGYGYKNSIAVAIGSSQVNYFLILTILNSYFKEYTMMYMTLLMWSLTSTFLPLTLGIAGWCVTKAMSWIGITSISKTSIEKSS